MDIKKILACTGKILGGLFLAPLVLIGLLVIYWDLREPPSYETDPVVRLESWTAIPSGDDARRLHKSNTDMIHYKGSFFLIHAATKWHLEDKNGVLMIQQSSDAKEWKDVAHIVVPDTDVRDPKFAIIKGKLFLYFLPNWSFDPNPTTTYWSVSEDGTHWDLPRELVTVRVVHAAAGGKKKLVATGGWKLWRPKTRDGRTWYVIASGKKPYINAAGDLVNIDVDTITVLLKSTDGVNWTEVSEVYTAHGNGEPCMEFMPDGSIIATLRCGSLGTGGYEFGNATGNTVIATSSPPYAIWSTAHSFITRLDGGTLFPLGGRIFAAGRDHLGPRFDMGNHLAKKRTAVYEVKKDRLVFLFDLPSNGDTAYTGVVRRGDDIYISYYTCPVDKDYPWILGICFLPRTEIRVARVSAQGLLAFSSKAENSR